jgi:hypothetical protein
MLKIYCSDCGSPSEYSLNKPKFCTNCGNSFEKNVVNKVLMQKQTISKIQPKKSFEQEVNIDEEDESNDNYDVKHVPNISNIDYELIGNEQKTQKIGNIMGTATGPREKKTREKTKKLTKSDLKKFREDFSKEAGSLRPKRGSKNG